MAADLPLDIVIATASYLTLNEALALTATCRTWAAAADALTAVAADRAFHAAWPQAPAEFVASTGWLAALRYAARLRPDIEFWIWPSVLPKTVTVAAVTEALAYATCDAAETGFNENGLLYTDRLLVAAVGEIAYEVAYGDGQRRRLPPTLFRYIATESHVAVELGFVCVRTWTATWHWLRVLYDFIVHLHPAFDAVYTTAAAVHVADYIRGPRAYVLYLMLMAHFVAAFTDDVAHYGRAADYARWWYALHCEWRHLQRFAATARRWMRSRDAADADAVTATLLAWIDAAAATGVLSPPTA